VLAVLAVFVAGTANPQGNIDAGKTPAQMFNDTCSACHKRAQALKRGASASFLRQHYMSGAEQASAMAAYLAGLPGDPKASEQRNERLKAQQEKAKAQQQARELAKVQAAPKGKKDAKALPAPPDPTPGDTTQRAEGPPVPKLEPFEE
jgi:mono/diheme cytochrome c family protein